MTRDSSNAIYGPEPGNRLQKAGSQNMFRHDCPDHRTPAPTTPPRSFFIREHAGHQHRLIARTPTQRARLTVRFQTAPERPTTMSSSMSGCTIRRSVCSRRTYMLGVNLPLGCPSTTTTRMR